MENLLSDLLKFLIEWIVVKPLLAIYRFVRFCVTTAARRRRMIDYKRYVREEFTSRGKPTPALILRIKNEYIRKYNQAAIYWVGRLLGLKTYPEVDSRPLAAATPINKSKDGTRSYTRKEVGSHRQYSRGMVRHRHNGRIAGRDCRR